MTGTPRPWWASAGPTDGLDDLDPLEAFRTLRRPGGAAEHGAGADRSAADAATAPDADGEAARSGGRTTGAPHRPELCGVCPLCTLARTLEESHPELVEHLTEAARHLSAAVRSLLEPPGTAGGPPDTSSDRLQHIDLERDEPDRPATDPGGRS